MCVLNPSWRSVWAVSTVEVDCLTESLSINLKLNIWSMSDWFTAANIITNIKALQCSLEMELAKVGCGGGVELKVTRRWTISIIRGLIKGPVCSIRPSCHTEGAVSCPLPAFLFSTYLFSSAFSLNYSLCPSFEWNVPCLLFPTLYRIEQNIFGHHILN